MSPSEALIADATITRQVHDQLGRKLTIRRLTALDKLRILKAAGPELSLNQPWLAVALLVSSVTAIDDVPVPSPANEAHVEALVGRLGEVGLDAAAEALDSPEAESSRERISNAGN
jgi:hypothetical protein